MDAIDTFQSKITSLYTGTSELARAAKQSLDEIKQLVVSFMDDYDANFDIDPFSVAYAEVTISVDGGFWANDIDVTYYVKNKGGNQLEFDSITLRIDESSKDSSSGNIDITTDKMPGETNSGTVTLDKKWAHSTTVTVYAWGLTFYYVDLSGNHVSPPPGGDDGDDGGGGGGGIVITPF